MSVAGHRNGHADTRHDGITGKAQEAGGIGQNLAFDADRIDAMSVYLRSQELSTSVGDLFSSYGNGNVFERDTVQRLDLRFDKPRTGFLILLFRVVFRDLGKLNPAGNRHALDGQQLFRIVLENDHPNEDRLL